MSETTEHAVVIVGGGPTGMMLGAELALAGVEALILERRPNQELDGSRARGLHSRAIELLDQRGVADRFLAEGNQVQITSFGETNLDISDLPTRHPYGLGLWQKHLERTLAGWTRELGVEVRYGSDVTGFSQEEAEVTAALGDGSTVARSTWSGATAGAARSARGRASTSPARRRPRARSSPRPRWRAIPSSASGDNPSLNDLCDALFTVYGSDFKVHSPTLISRFTDATRQAPESLLDTYQAERHPPTARALRYTMAQNAISRVDPRTAALRDTFSEVMVMDEPRKHLAAMISGLDVRYDLGEGHPLLGRRVPDLDLVTADGPTHVYALLHSARPVLLNFGKPGAFDIGNRPEHVQLIDGRTDGPWELPAIGEVDAPAAVLIRPDGHVAWVGDRAESGLDDTLSVWFGAAVTT